MKITVRNDYLIFPVYTRATEKTLTFSQKGNKIFALDIKLDNVSPDFYAYIDVSLFKGEALELSVQPEMPILFWESDEMRIENLYWESVRPQVHFTVKNGWMGAPEALVRKDGSYILLYPHNPTDTVDGNDLWGYAVSRDLIRWNEENVALLPENDAAVLRGQAKASLQKTRELRSFAQRERTDLFSLADREGNRKWVLMCENGGYRIGDFREGVFTAEQEEKTFRYGSPVGKGVTFTDSDRTIHMEWDSCRGAHFCGQMSIPMELSLEKDGGVHFLSAKPMEALEGLYKNTNRYEDLMLGTKEIPLADTAHTISLQGAPAKQGVLKVTLFGREILLDFAANRMVVGNSECPISLTGNQPDLKIVADRQGVEIFADGGRIYMSCLGEDMFMDRNLLSMTLCCDVAYRLEILEIHSLESIR